MPTLQRDAESLYEAATRFIRVYQFRGRDSALRFDLTVAQAYALDVLLACGGTSLNGVAQALRLDKSTTSRIVSGMERAGLIEWSRPDHDQRAKQIVASSEGKRRYGRLRRAIVRDNARLLATYSPGARTAIIKALRQLAARALPDSGSRLKPPADPTRARSGDEPLLP